MRTIWTFRALADRFSLAIARRVRRYRTRSHGPLSAPPTAASICVAGAAKNGSNPPSFPAGFAGDAACVESATKSARARRGEKRVIRGRNASGLEAVDQSTDRAEALTQGGVVGCSHLARQPAAPTPIRTPESGPLPCPASSDEKRRQGDRAEILSVDAHVELPQHSRQATMTVAVEIDRTSMLAVPASEGIVAENYRRPIQ